MKSRIHFASFSLWEEELSQSIHLTRQTHTLLLINCRQRQWLPDDLSKACNAIPFPTDHFLFATELDNQQTISPFFQKELDRLFPLFFSLFFFRRFCHDFLSSQKTHHYDGRVSLLAFFEPSKTTNPSSVLRNIIVPQLSFQLCFGWVGLNGKTLLDYDDDLVRESSYSGCSILFVSVLPVDGRFFPFLCLSVLLPLLCYASLVVK